MALAARRTPKVQLKEVNSVLTCTLCGGYFVDATTLVDCLHVFCRGCIVKHLSENSKLGCPTCNKKKTCIRPDPQMQALVYKVVPGLYQREMQRREDFYRSTGVRASSSCSDDSVLGDLKQDQEKWMLRNVDHTTHFYSPDDSISLSLEYYQYHLDETSTDNTTSTKKPSAISASEQKVSDNNNEVQKSANDENIDAKRDDSEERVRDRRYLQCPAAVTMSHLQKFLRMKYGLSPEHKVDIIYEGEVLPVHYNLMDVAYTFNWSKIKPMRFFYRIFTPMKIQPIKIINTSSSGGKQLQIVPVKPNPDPKLPTSPVEAQKIEESEEGRDNKSKERLMAHLKLKSNRKTDDSTTKEPHCVYEYEEPDKEEIKRFAENRDREWARMHETSEPTHHVSKKRKKNKHSKSDAKKRKIHAEISSSDVKQECIKLKVKLHNGHKHKHRSPQIVEAAGSSSEPKRHKSTEKIEEPAKSVEAVEQEKLEQQTFLKTFQSDTESGDKPTEKIESNKVEKEKKPLNTYSNTNQVKLLEKKIASLQQQCTIEAKKQFNNEKPHILNTHIQPTGFTVSKVEAGKRKVEEEPIQDKRPSLEITLITPPIVPETKVKRPPPATIPLERIKKSMKSGVTIIPKLPDKCDNIGALDLTKPCKDIIIKPNGITTLNGLKSVKLPDKNTPLSNLQMLSKVASEHNKQPNNNNNKVRPQIPNLQSLIIPANKNNLPKLHKLNDINKSQFRLLNNSQTRTMRPNQNQSIRNIPNPSLLVNRQQNQNRLNAQQNGDKEPKILNTLAKENNKEEKKVEKKVENGVSS